MPWVYDPHSGGTKIPVPVKNRIKNRILVYAKKHYQGQYERIDVRFRSQFCYIDAYVEPDVPDAFPPADFPISRAEHIEKRRNTPIHLCRIRYFGDENS